MAEKPSGLTRARGHLESRVPGAGLGVAAAIGAGGSALLALATDLPGSPYGPHAGGLWPLAGHGPAPGWEGPTVPSWTMVAVNQGPGVGPGRLLATLAVIAAVAALGFAWFLVWRRVRGVRDGGVRRLWWVVGAWVAPLLLAAPFASQDVWTYGAEGKMVVDGFGGYRPASALGHSVWTLGVDAKWIAHPSPYGPGALDLSAFFVRISGGRPWVAAECWRLATVVGLVLCAWGVHRIVSLSGADGAAAALVGVANPAVLLILVAGIHNDGLMLGLTVAGLAVALSGRRSAGMMLCAVGVAVKPNALLIVGALVWWVWGGDWRHRIRGTLVAATSLAAVLAVSGLPVGGGFGWVKADLSGGIPGPWSLGAQLLGPSSHWLVDVIEVAGLAVAIAMVIAVRRPGGWVVSLGWAFAALAVTTPRPEPWYLTWAAVLLVCGGLRQRSERIGVLVLVAMMAGSILPLQVLWWFEGVIALAWIGFVSARTRSRTLTEPTTAPIDTPAVTGEAHRPPSDLASTSRPRR